MQVQEKGDRIFPTQEIGSIAKPSWRVRGVSDEAKITSQDIVEAERWGKTLEIENCESLIDLLKKRQTLSTPPGEIEKDAIRDWSVRYVLRLFDKANLDHVYSGEQWRVEMYEHLVRNIQGFKLLGSVHSFDYKYFTKGAVVDEPRFRQPIHLAEFEFVKSNTSKLVKIPITGPYTVVDWSFNEFYETQLRNEYDPEKLPDLRRIYFEARRKFMIDLVKNVLRREVSELISHGATWIQIDEPAVTTRPDDEEMELFVDAINELTSGFSGCTFSVHNCYSDYRLLARYAPRLRDITQLALEFANRDSTELGVSLDERPGYAVLQNFIDQGYSGGIGLGVTHVHDYSDKPGNGARVEGRSIIESPELIRDRILVASKILRDPSRISVNPDCGLRTRTWDVTYEKLLAMDRGAELARRSIS